MNLKRKFVGAISLLLSGYWWIVNNFKVHNILMFCCCFMREISFTPVFCKTSKRERESRVDQDTYRLIDEGSADREHKAVKYVVGFTAVIS